jgi:hypothetical protein
MSGNRNGRLEYIGLVILWVVIMMAVSIWLYGNVLPHS